jgi:DNA-binding transcriptional MerR regulator
MEKTGISADTLRYYEKEGLLSPKRSENGYRQYDDDDITILKNIIVMKYAHFTLNEMKSMEEMYARNPSANCNEICQGILNSKVTELRQVICNYQKIVLLLEELLKMIGGVEAYLANKERVDEFIQQIFDDIQNGEG